MHILQKVSCKIHIDVNIFSPKQVESISRSISRLDLPGGIVRTIYNHPSIKVATFKAEFFVTFLKNLNKESKEVI